MPKSVVKRQQSDRLDWVGERQGMAQPSVKRQKPCRGPAEESCGTDLPLPTSPLWPLRSSMSRNYDAADIWVRPDPIAFEDASVRNLSTGMILGLTRW